jgi:hypothetical protein
MSLNATNEEFKKFILSTVSAQPFGLELLDGFDPSTNNIELEKLLNLYFPNGTIMAISFTHSRNDFIASFNINPTKSTNIIKFYLDPTTQKINSAGLFGGNQDSSLDFANHLLGSIYSFKAERLKVGVSRFGKNSILSPDAANLPEVLNILQGDTSRFKRFNSYIAKVFPQIFQVTVRPSPNRESDLEIVVWNEDPEMERSDLAVPLVECGTGISQVLAILYVVLTADIPKVIIIDEPNSFLHPGAAKKLIEIFKEHPQHQFIISTHSPSTLAASNPKTIHVVRIKDAESSIETIDLTETNNQQAYLAEIGVKLSDVFGADNILWVEGKTEEICFPKIVEKMSGVSLMGTTIAAVVNTGDFYKKRNPELIFSVYEKLCKGKGLLPPAIGFVFDSEKLSSKEKQDLKRRSNDKVIFLPRRMFENYLLNAKAISQLLDTELGEFDLSEQVIIDWLAQNKWDRQYLDQRLAKDKTENEWLVGVDGAKLLKNLLSDLTNGKLAFDKIKHSVFLCTWIIENSFEDLNEIQEMLLSVLNPSKLSK